MAHFEVKWRKPRRALRLLDFDNWPETPPSTDVGEYPASGGHPVIRVKFSRKIQVIEHNVYPETPVPPTPYGRVSSRVKIHFDVKWRKQRRALNLLEFNVYPSTPPPPPADDLVESWLGHFERTGNRTHRRLLGVITPPDFPQTPPAPPQPETAYLSPLVNRRSYKRKAIFDPTLSTYLELDATYELVEWRIIDGDGDPVTGATPTIQIQRVSDRLWLDWSDGTFNTSPTTLKRLITEQYPSQVPGSYSVLVNIFDFNGKYHIYAEDLANSQYSEIGELIVVDGIVWSDNVTDDLAAVKAKAVQLTFTKANELDSNIQSVNDVTVAGTGAPGDTWGP